MRRFAVIAALCASPAAGWEATIGPICALSHAETGGAMRLTYDPTLPEYAITVTRQDGEWSDAPVFAIAFFGPRGLTISTDRHSIDGKDVTVTDRGFGNVLNGLEFNDTATAFLGDQSVTVSLAGAAAEVRKFRDCVVAPSV